VTTNESTPTEKRITKKNQRQNQNPRPNGTHRQRKRNLQRIRPNPSPQHPRPRTKTTRNRSSPKQSRRQNLIGQHGKRRSGKSIQTLLPLRLSMVQRTSKPQPITRSNQLPILIQTHRTPTTQPTPPIRMRHEPTALQLQRLRRNKHPSVHDACHATTTKLTGRYEQSFLRGLKQCRNN
jgi:hypothetical protein